MMQVISGSPRYDQSLRRCIQQRESPRILGDGPDSGIKILEVAHDWVAVQAAVQADGGPLDAELSRASAAGYATADLWHIETAKVFWLLAPVTPTSGAWVDLGYALGRIAAVEQHTALPAPIHVIASGAVEWSIFCACADEEHATDQGAFESITVWGHRWEKSHGSKREAQAEPISE